MHESWRIKEIIRELFQLLLVAFFTSHRIVYRDLNQRGDTEIDGSLKMEPDRSLLASVRDDRFKQLRICVWV
jgi:hypothetical protein